jgi:uncharacterized protein
VQENGQPESAATEATASGPDHPADAAPRIAGPEAREPVPDQPVPVEPGAGRSAGQPVTADPAGSAPVADGAAVPAPATATPLPPAWLGNDATSAGDGAALPPPAPSGPFPDSGAPPSGWYPVGSGSPYAAGPPPYPPGPYPPGPYPSAGSSAAPPSAAPASSAPPWAPPPSAPPPRGLAAWGAPSPTRTHRWGLGAYLLAEAVFLLTSVLVGFVVVGDAGPTASTLAVALAVPTVLAAATALLITWVRGNGPRVDLGLAWSWRDVGLGLAFGFGGLALTIPASIVYVAIVGEDATSAVGDVFGGIRAGPALAVLVLVIVVLVAPACEEILYRGLLWGGIERLAGRWVAFVVTTLLFALAHFEFTRTPLLFVVAIPIAIARLYTGRLLASIVAHQVNNLLPGIVLLLGLLGVIPMA